MADLNPSHPTLQAVPASALERLSPKLLSLLSCSLASFSSRGFSMPLTWLAAFSRQLRQRRAQFEAPSLALAMRSAVTLGVGSPLVLIFPLT